MISMLVRQESAAGMPTEARDALSKVFRSGQRAFEAGRELTENPFAVGSKARSAWAGGWHLGKRMDARKSQT